jgi:DNA-binding PadR family transcriptional regulator
MPRRKAGTLLPLELKILEHGLARPDELYGYSIAQAIAEDGGALTAHGTLYKALGRMVAAGLLDARWEDASIAEEEGRPRRRLYEVTGEGARAAAAATVAPTSPRAALA